MIILSHHKPSSLNIFVNGVKYGPVINAMTDMMIPMLTGRQNIHEKTSPNLPIFLDANSLNLEITSYGPLKYTNAIDIP